MNGNRAYFPYKLLEVDQKQGLSGWFHVQSSAKAFFLLWDPEERQWFGKATAEPKSSISFKKEKKIDGDNFSSSMNTTGILI